LSYREAAFSFHTFQRYIIIIIILVVDSGSSEINIEK
jgi:hypothetical protein